jgi:hypothetical protein
MVAFEGAIVGVAEVGLMEGAELGITVGFGVGVPGI